MPWCDEFVTYYQNFDFKIRRDHQKNILWASCPWVGRRKELILGYVPKNNEKKNSGSKGLKYIIGAISTQIHIIAVKVREQMTCWMLVKWVAQHDHRKQFNI